MSITHNDYFGKALTIGDIVLYPGDQWNVGFSVVTKFTPKSVRVGSGSLFPACGLMIANDMYLEKYGQAMFDKKIATYKKYLDEKPVKAPNPKHSWVISIRAERYVNRGDKSDVKYLATAYHLVDGVRTNKDNGKANNYKGDSGHLFGSSVSGLRYSNYSYSSRNKNELAKRTMIKHFVQTPPQTNFVMYEADSKAKMTRWLLDHNVYMGKNDNAL